MEKQMNDVCFYLNNKTKEKIESLTEICNEMIRFGQRFLILEGGLAVGKTLFAKEIAKKLVNGINGNIHLFQLHDGYSYSNFIYGQQIETEKGKIVYKKGDQPLLKILNKCVESNSEGKQELQVVILDDINRCDINAVFGDMFTALESDEIGNAIKTDGGDIKLPKNLFFIATMNPLVGKESIDYAWFRRFTVVNLQADSSLFEPDDNSIKEYREYLWYAKEIFEHVKMLFELYYADKDNPWEKEKYIPGAGLFLQYDDNKDLRGNLWNLQHRIEHIIVPILYECISAGILSVGAIFDIDALCNLQGNTISYDLNWDARAEKMKTFVEVLKKGTEKYSCSTNAFFFFILHSSNPQFKVLLNDYQLCLIEFNGLSVEINEKAQIRRKNGLKPYSDQKIDVSNKDKREEGKYRHLSGTAMETMSWANDRNIRFYAKEKECVVDKLIKNEGLIEKYLDRINNIFKVMKGDQL